MSLGCRDPGRLRQWGQQIQALLWASAMCATCRGLPTQEAELGQGLAWVAVPQECSCLSPPSVTGAHTPAGTLTQAQQPHRAGDST